MLKSSEPDFPFRLCWAKETWSRTWLGEEREILLKQQYSGEDDCGHGLWLAEVFKDGQYIGFKGLSGFLV